MKKLILFLLITTLGYAQAPTKNSAGFFAGTGTMNASAIGQFDSTAKGFLFPRMTTTQRNAISSPATSLVIFNTTTATYNYYDGSAWVAFGGGSSTNDLNTTMGFGNFTEENLQFNGGAYIDYFDGTYHGILDTETLGAARTWALPNKSGTIALTSDIPTDPFIPMTGTPIDQFVTGTVKFKNTTKTNFINWDSITLENTATGQSAFFGWQNFGVGETDGVNAWYVGGGAKVGLLISTSGNGETYYLKTDNAAADEVDRILQVPRILPADPERVLNISTSVNGGDPVFADEFGNIDLTVSGGSSTTYLVSIYHPDGTIDGYNPSTNTNTARGTALLDAIGDATSGDVIKVGVGTYECYGLQKNGITLDFAEGAIVEYTGATLGAIIFDFDSATDMDMKVVGNGVFRNMGTGGGNDVIDMNNPDSSLIISCKSIYSDINRATINDAGILDITVEDISSEDGVIDITELTPNTTFTTVHAKNIIGIGGFALEHDGGTLKVFAEKIGGLGIFPPIATNGGTTGSVYVKANKVTSSASFSVELLNGTTIVTLEGINFESTGDDYYADVPNTLYLKNCSSTQTESGVLTGNGNAVYLDVVDVSDKELISNKQTNLTASATKYPTVNAVNTGLDLKANLASPTFTGTVTIPNGSILGTPTSVNLANATFPTLNQNTTGTAANLSGTPALPNGTTATTQASSDNSTKIATTAYSQPRIQDMVLSSNYTLTSSTSAQKLFNVGTSSNGTFTASASTLYDFEMFVSLTSLSSTSGSFSFSLGGTATYTSLLLDTYGSKTATITGSAFIGIMTSASAYQITTNTTGTVGTLRVKGKIRVNGAGTIEPRIALSVASAGVVGANSYCTFREIGSSSFTATSSFD